MFSKLALKYRVSNPLTTQPEPPSTLGGQKGERTTLQKPDSNFSSPSFGNITPSTVVPDNKPIAQKPPLFGGQPSTNSFAFGPTTPQVAQPPAFGLASGSTNSTFGSGNAGSTSLFGSSSSSSTTMASPFGQSPAPSRTLSPFGSTGIGQAATSPAPSGSSSTLFNGRSARDLLHSFYQQYNPQKLAEVDKLLGKYQGNEEQMFRNLAKKYNMDPSVFGLPAAPPVGFGAGGVASATSASPAGFGQPSSLGGGPTFGGVSSPAAPSFGGSPFASTAAAPAGFGFGSLAQSPSSGFGSFGSSASSPFSTSTPFGAPRR